MEKNYFIDLFGVDVSNKFHKKKYGNTTLSYLSWSWAWAEVKKRYPDAIYKIHRYGEDNAPYHHDKNLGYMVSTEVTIGDITHEMWLPVMDHSNKAMKDHEYTYETKYKKDNKVEQATMFDVNTAIMRCLVKNIGMHGLGLHIYAGEDIPRDLNEELENEVKEKEVKEKEVDKKNIQNDITNIFNSLIKEFGSNEIVYENIGIDRDKFLEMYNIEPDKLWETLKQYA